MTSASPFSAEIGVFEKYRAEWLREHSGKYVAIQDDIVVDGFFVTYAEAFTAGVKRFGVSRSFLIKQIRTTEPVYFVS